jgi:uncharacterized protein (UPF0248 family)
MITIRELLNRIRWDREYGRAEFAIGYFDRVEDRILIVPLGEILFTSGGSFSFQLTDREEVEVSIPLHRICRVYRNHELIWQRRRRGEADP